jgi:hypothetical protein
VRFDVGAGTAGAFTSFALDRSIAHNIMAGGTTAAPGMERRPNAVCRNGSHHASLTMTSS